MPFRVSGPYGIYLILRTCALLIVRGIRAKACPQVVRRIGLGADRASLRLLVWNYLKARKIGAA